MQQCIVVKNITLHYKFGYFKALSNQDLPLALNFTTFKLLPCRNCNGIKCAILASTYKTENPDNFELGINGECYTTSNIDDNDSLINGEVLDNGQVKIYRGEYC